MKRVIRILILLAVLSFWSLLSAQAGEKFSPVFLSARAILPNWVSTTEMLRHYIRNKYYVDPRSCDPLVEGKWLCHIDCGRGCILDSVFDLTSKREAALPVSTVPYYFLPQWQMLVGLAFLPSLLGWDLSLVSLRLSDLGMESTAIGSLPHQEITSLALFPKGKRVGFDMEYCLAEFGCWRDRFRLRNGTIILKSHRGLKEERN